MDSTAARRYTAVIADDHQIVREGLRVLLADAPEIVVVAEARDGLEAIAQVKAHRPSLLLLDVAMPLLGGAEALAESRRWSPGTKVVMLTGLTSRGLLRRIADGAPDAVLLKTQERGQLVEAVRAVLAGRRYVSPEAQAALDEAERGPALTAREMQILSLVASGHGNRQIADLLGISAKTVDRHRTNLMGKLGVHSVAELMAYALREGLLEPAKHL